MTLDPSLVLSAVATWLLGAGLRIAVILALALAALWLSNRWLRRLFSALQTVAPGQQQRTRTLAGLAQGTVSMVIVIGTALSVLSALSVPVGPLVASAGIVGIAIAVGSQALVRDVLAGLFILVENQFVIGEQVKIAGVSGEVERVGLRATWLRDSLGQLHVVPNSTIGVVTNLSRQYAVVAVRLAMSATMGPEQIAAALEKVTAAAAADAELGPLLLAAPFWRGPEDVSGTSIAYEVVARVVPNGTERARRRLRLLALDETRSGGLQLV
ncbi:MAG: mechanosensitive ion channel family protein [Anaerolineae bacterium]